MSPDPTQRPWYEVRGADLLLRVRVKPRSAHEGLEAARDGRLPVRVSAPPVEGAANARVVLLLSQALAVPRSCVVVMRGAKSRDKDVLVHGAAGLAGQLIARLQQPDPDT